jgi:hypothetical protein
MRKIELALLFLFFSCRALAYDANGVALGASEDDVKKKYPSAHCQVLEWKSKAADRRCDDARVAFGGGVQARITFYLNRNAVQAFDVRFDTRDIERVSAFLKGAYGEPLGETRDTMGRDKKSERHIYKVRWEKGGDHAVLVSEKEKNRSSLLVSRGNFEEEIYRVR